MINTLESNSRSYSRIFPAKFATAKGSSIWTSDGFRYLDFLGGAGALVYGHNPNQIREAILSHIESDGITHALDFFTVTKDRLIEEFSRTVLDPLSLTYRFQFTGPTGTNAVEAAFKVARKYTNRTNIVAFTNGFHGMSLGALSASANRRKRAGAMLPLGSISHAPYDGYFDCADVSIDTVQMLRQLILDPGSGFDEPAAFIVETIQGEGGLAMASVAWLRALRALASEIGALLVVDEIQTGCGRTGSYFGFEEAGIDPDVICLSKGLSGYGLPLALVLIRPEFDIQNSGDHSGTFRGHTLAMEAGRAALRMWNSESVRAELKENAHYLDAWLQGVASKYQTTGIQTRGRGMIRGISWENEKIAPMVRDRAYSSGLLVETSGASGNTIKLLPALNIVKSELEEGLAILEKSVAGVVNNSEVH